MDNKEYYEVYKPLRNRIRQFNLIDSLFVIWSFSRNYTFNHPFSREIQLPQGFNPSLPLAERRLNGIYEHELEFLVREIIINCHLKKCNKSLSQINNLSKVINYVRHDLFDRINHVYDGERNILLEFNRITHRQFKWQVEYSHQHMLRMYKVYSAPEIDQLVISKTGLSVYEIHCIGVLLFHMTSKNFRTKIPLDLDMKFITPEKINKFLNLFAMSLDDAKNAMIQNHEIDETLFYSFNPISAKPLLIFENTLICPIHLPLYWQFNSGVYYSIVNEDGFQNAFGKSFETYIGDILLRSLDKKKFTITSELIYDKPEKRSSDWIVSDDNAILFIECKTKRMTMYSVSIK